MKKHATADIENEPDSSLCGEHLWQDDPRHAGARLRNAIRVDNANPDCLRCLRSIAKVLKCAH